MKILHDPAAFAALWLRSRLEATHYMVRYMLPNRRRMNEVRALRNSARGREAFVFAAGPSMLKLDPHKIRRLQDGGRYDVFGINHYEITAFGTIARANQYVISDHGQWSGILTPGALLGLSEEKQRKFQAETHDLCSRTWSALRRPGVRLFVPIEKLAITDHPDVHPFCDALDLFSDNVDDITRPLGLRPLTAYKALSIACFLGYDRIYICGFDNDSFLSIRVGPDNRKSARYAHYYDTEDQVQTTSSDGRLSENLFFTALTFASLEKFDRHPIINLDPTGLVDCFSKRHDLDVYAR